MENSFNMFELVLRASIVVQLVIAILIAFSIISWAIILQRSRTLTRTLKESYAFEDRFWSGEDLERLYEGVAKKTNDISGNAHIFFVGYKEFVRLRLANPEEPKAILQGSLRAMNLTMNREVEYLESRIPFLATVASTSPYIGLFGTVWGIMHAFIALGGVKQATLQMVAPGIAEALIATAMGLFAAIPAVMAYNRLSLRLNKIEQAYANFIDEFMTVLHRKVFDKAKH